MTGRDDAAHVFRLGERLRNWGRWGDDDAKGTLSYITPAHRVGAASLVRRGAVFSLALPISDGEGPMIAQIAGRFNPIHHMTQTGDRAGPVVMGGTADITDDVLVMGCQSSTHWDALCHVYYEGRIYNGWPASTVSAAGAAHGDIDAVHTDFVARGVLLDVPLSMSSEALDPGYAITAADLERCAESQSVDVNDGDVILVRTGAIRDVRDDDWSSFYANERPGLHYTTAEWFASNRVAAVAADNGGVEAPSRVEGLRMPLHMLAVRDMGMPLGEYFYLEELAADCRTDGVYEFMLIAQPLRIKGGTGSPMNPLAIK